MATMNIKHDLLQGSTNLFRSTLITIFYVIKGGIDWSAAVRWFPSDKVGFILYPAI